MGSACCCLRGEWEDYTNPNSTIYRNCICLNYFLRNFVHVYTSLFNREDRSLPSPTQGTTALSSIASIDDSIPDTYRSPPRPLPYDADPRYFRLQRDGLVSSSGKGSSQNLNEETEPLRGSEVNQEESGLATNKSKWNDITYEEGSKEHNSKSSIKPSTDNPARGFAHIYTCSDDEDVCPTCLEEYSTENPKIITKCAHHFHLGCIYEWMERSDTCPVCGKLMDFDETT
ncbi:E3 ubiquitin-protein ligase At3g02290-like [Andrographis paniculata]|uniref:E3 ubiquitin-protein ligase At3g02290-like n=1 Tax=Andrographis paniculata TaxID=175694 RepID=UPI0021E72A81|nr:E3 ubiquitin-protein ligase At3g02290-like [Andrographis paniculata]XP_051114733.1 E3 ubiquitin-protein ligase At3g02290-like [Andrographis paniculata]